jgi:hypothetical protein
VCECAHLSIQLDIAKDEFNTAVGVSDGLKGECDRLRAVADAAKALIEAHPPFATSAYDAIVAAVRSLE